LALACSLLIGSSMAGKAAVTFDLQQVFDGVTPGGTDPWVTVSITDSGSDAILTVSTIGTGLAAGDYLKSLYLNFDGSLPLTFTHLSTTGTIDADTTSQSANAFPADGHPNNFDIAIVFGDLGNNFDPGESISWVVAGASASQFNVRAAGAVDGYYVAGLIGVDDGKGVKVDSWVTVPEPSTYVAAALLMIPVLVQLRRWTRNKATA